MAGTPGEKVKNNPMQGRTARNVQMMTTAVAGSAIVYLVVYPR